MAAGLFACQNANKNSVKELTQEEKDNAARDSANFTSIQWLDSTFKDLGKVKEGQVVEVSYRFKNVGNKNLVIANVTASCGCTVPEKPTEPIAPGATAKLKVQYSAAAAGQFNKDVYIKLAGIDEQKVVHITGEVLTAEAYEALPAKDKH